MQPVSQRSAPGSPFRKVLFFGIIAIIVLPFAWLVFRALFPQQSIENPLLFEKGPSARAQQAKIWADEVENARREGREPDYSKKPSSEGRPVGGRSATRLPMTTPGTH